MIECLEEGESPCLPRKTETPIQQQRRLHTQLIMHVIKNVRYIAQRFKQMEEEDQVTKKAPSRLLKILYN